MSLKPTFQGEVQFRRWSDSSTQGVQITFGLPDSSDLEPLKAKAGKRFMAVLVEIGDDEQPVQQPTGWAGVGPKCREALDLTDNPAFREYVAAAGFAATQVAAEKYIKASCGIESRKELDASDVAYRRFIKQVREPFLAWVRERKAA